MAIGGIWQYSFTTVASSADASLFASQFLIACVHVVCIIQIAAIHSFRQDHNFVSVHAVANDSLPTKPWGNRQPDRGTISERVSCNFLTILPRVQAQSGRSPSSQACVGRRVYHRQSQQKNSFKGFPPRRRHFKYIKSTFVPLKMSRIIMRSCGGYASSSSRLGIWCP